MIEKKFEKIILGDFSLKNYINANVFQIEDFTYPIRIIDSEVKSITSMLLNISTLKIENVIFNELDKDFSINLYCSVIYKELLIKDCVISKPSNFFAIHALGEVTIENCTFEEFVDFGDCWFKNNTVIRNNTFKKGTNLLGNLDKPYKVTFDKKPIIENNKGDLRMNVLP